MHILEGVVCQMYICIVKNKEKNKKKKHQNIILQNGSYGG
jgi:hypothetical protein